MTILAKDYEELNNSLLSFEKQRYLLYYSLQFIALEKLQLLSNNKSNLMVGVTTWGTLLKDYSLRKFENHWFMILRISSSYQFENSVFETFYDWCILLETFFHIKTAYYFQ